LWRDRFTLARSRKWMGTILMCGLAAKVIGLSGDT
jgi:hypothetical protein